MISMFKNKESLAKLSSINKHLIVLDDEAEQRKIENYLQSKLDGFNRDVKYYMEINDD